MTETITQYDFFRTKYGDELLIDLVRLEDLEKYIRRSPVQRLSYYDITIIAGGSGTFNIDGHEKRLRRGNVFFSAPGQIRKWSADKTPEGYVLIFEEEFLQTFLNDTQFVYNLPCFSSYNNPPIVQLAPEEYDRLTDLFQDIKNEISSFMKNDKHLLRALLYQSLVLLNRKFVATYPTSQKKPVNYYVNQFIPLVKANVHQFRNVDYYAQQLCITSGHLNVLVKDYFGITAKKYILNMNILEAKRLLQYTNLTIQQIAYRLNYENTAYFIRVFREHTDITPSRFRKQTKP
jgi:AraC-like DNA-binding protein